jgi:aspartyl-tRNA(Asn)/glutamyl-tRNA(Gln) amidotransferase subunit B
MEFEIVIGLEVHVQLNTLSKIFSGAPAHYGALPNEHIDPVTLGLPGSLPVLNEKVLESAVMLGLATNCEIRHQSIFARKHYFYPDLPKGYQISQFEEPICERGFLIVRSDNQKGDNQKRSIGITRIHMEEDAGKSIHNAATQSSRVDLNRAGVPLLEVVSEPDLRSPQEAANYMRTLRQLVVWLGINDGNLEEGSLRCDANISLRPLGQLTYGTRTEIKNLNSYRFIEKALEYEIARQHKILKSGGTITQETRLYDSENDCTRSMRGKEGSADYRYFPDPDLPPVIVEESLLIKIEEQLPKLPEACFQDLTDLQGLSDSEATVLISEKDYYDFYTAAHGICGNAKATANWLINELLGYLNRNNIEIRDLLIKGEQLGELIKLIDQDVISGKIAKGIFENMLQNGKSASEIVKEKGLQQLNDPAALEKAIAEILANNQAQVDQYRTGNEKVIGFLVGQIMKATQGKAHPKMLNELLLKQLKG